MTCIFDGCDKKVHSRNMCSTHVWKARQSGSIDEYPPMRLKETVWTVEKLLEECETSGDCKVSPRHPSQRYPKVYHRGRPRLAHRLMYELYNEEKIEPFKETGIVIHHTCSNRRCINPEHLQRAMAAENTLEMLSRKDYEAEIARLQLKVAALELQLDKEWSYAWQ